MSNYDDYDDYEDYADYTDPDLTRHKKCDTVKWILTLVGFILVAVMLVGIICGWFTPKETPTMSEPKVTESGAETGGLYIPETENGTGISLVSAVIPVSQYEEYGVMPIAESAQTLTATVQPDNNAENTKVKWEASFKNPASSWAEGKTLSDYLTLSFGDEYNTSKTCVVSCLQAFGEQIIIKVSSLDNPDVTAEVKADYVQKVTDFSLSFGGINCTFDGTTEVPVEVNATGTPVGGTPQLNQTLSETYSLADSFTVTYSLSESGERILYDETRHMYVNWWDFGTAEYIIYDQYDSTEKEKVDRSVFTSYDVANKGLYFGFKYFIDNMGMNYFYAYSRGNSNASAMSNPEQYLVPDTMLKTYNAIIDGGTYNDGTFDHVCSGLNLFRLTVKIQGQYSTVEKSTLFKIKTCTNSTTIADVSTDEQNLYF